MSKYKKATYIILFFMLATVLFHAIIWNTLTKHILLVDDMTYNGDLGRFSFKKDSIHSRPTYLDNNSYTLRNRHINFKDINEKEIDVITIGDSFSNAATQGYNPFYQDYIATFNDLTVLNIIPTYGFFETVNILNNTGILDIINPKIIIIESLENFCVDRFSNSLNVNINKDKDIVLTHLNTQINSYLKKDPSIRFINNHNIKAFLYNLKRGIINKYGVFGKVHIAKLEKDMFTTKDSNSLLFYKSDLDSISLSTKDKIIQLNSNFNKLSHILKRKGIELYFMPIVSKYNLYDELIINNEYKHSIFFEYLRELKKDYQFIDTKDILGKELKKGVKDLYYSDDTHWSYKASEAIFRKVTFD